MPEPAGRGRGARCQWMAFEDRCGIGRSLDRESDGDRFSNLGTFGKLRGQPTMRSVAVFLQFHGSEIGILQTNAP